MFIFPAIDIRDNKVVRLSKGDYNQMKVYSADVKETALSFRQQGSTHLHIVDLDGAKAGIPYNQNAIKEIATVEGMFFQIGGGIRTEQRIEDYLRLGINRVILGTVALENPDFVGEMVKKYGSAIAVGVDAKGGKVATHGWLETSNRSSFTFVQEMADRGVSTIIYTDIAKDGMLSGCNLGAYERLSTIPELQIIASGGVSSLAELQALKEMGCYGAIVGKAIYEGKISLGEALAL